MFDWRAVKTEHAAGPDLAEVLAAYIQWHARVLQSPNAKLRYVVYYPDYNGLGNRFRALLSWYLIAVLTGRVFLVSWTEPYGLHEYVEIAAMDTRLANLPPDHNYTEFRQLLCSKCTNESYECPMGSEPIDHLLDRHDPPFWSKLHWPVLVGTGCADSVPTLLQRSDMRSLTLTSAIDPHCTLASSLDLRPTPTLQASLDEEDRIGQIQRADRRIGLQVRMGSNHTGFCRVLDDGGEEMHFGCVESMLKASQSSAPVIFLASDDDDVTLKARERFGARLLLVNRSVVHSGMQQMQDGSGRARKADDFAKVMADWWLMGEMDELVGTASCHTTHPKGCMGGSRSSFGVTAAWRRCVPVVLLPADAADAACLGNARTAVGAAWSVEVA